MMNVKELDNMVDKYRVILQEINNGMGFSIDIAQAIEEQGDEKRLQELEETMKEYIELEETIKLHKAALAAVKRHINQENMKLGEAYKRARENDQEIPDYKQHGKYKEFRQKVWQVKHPNDALPDQEDEDIVEMHTQTENDFICPLTRKELEDPVKNIPCGHTYSREAIVDYMKKGKSKRGKFPCPVAGCSGELTKETLEKDMELERQLRRNKQRGGTKKKKPEEEDITNLD
eukprot:Phypoly_transcript_08056.p1 GENE.Phypoly_transcript_08056~~Phypoly_transcript_08056.p1  ORF type:complete len:232 (-),score=56.16 Phypoly_transcript_08056:190-885(-)